MTATATVGLTSLPESEDPYARQSGFGSSLSSEAVPNILLHAANVPASKVKYGLYREHLNGASASAPQSLRRHVSMYRVRPSGAHRRVETSSDVNPFLESFFSPTNDNVEFRPSRLLWAPFPLPIERGLFRTSNGTTFLRGIRTVAGTGDPIRGDGLALHVYTADVSMTKEAFANNDGDLLILPEKGRLSIQTELGRLMVRPGELVVIPAGIRFRVQLPDGPVRGYIQEIFGAHYEPTTSPDDSPSSGFEHPVASFDLDESSWNITYKLAGALQEYLQDHSPFDVVAWHGNLVPFKYAIDNLTSGNRHRSGVTLDCVLTAPSRLSGVSIAEFLVLNLKHTAGPHVGPPTHCHRKSGTEIMGLLHGRYGDNPYTLEPGGLSYEASYMPHRDIGDLWHDASIHEPEDDQQCLDTTAFLFQCSAPLLLTRWAVRGDGAKLLRPCVSDQRATVRAQFLDHFDEVNADLQAAGLPTLPRQTRSHR